MHYLNFVRSSYYFEHKFMKANSLFYSVTFKCISGSTSTCNTAIDKRYTIELEHSEKYNLRVLNWRFQQNAEIDFVLKKDITFVENTS